MPVKTPEQMREETKQKELYKQQREKQILEFSEDFEEAKDCKGFKNMMAEMQQIKEIEFRELEIFKNATELEKCKRSDNKRYIVEKATLEARQALMEYFLNLPEEFKKNAEIILNRTSDTPSPGSRSGVQMEEKKDG